MGVQRGIEPKYRFRRLISAVQGTLVQCIEPVFTRQAQKKKPPTAGNGHQRFQCCLDTGFAGSETTYRLLRTRRDQNVFRIELTAISVLLWCSTSTMSLRHGCLLLSNPGTLRCHLSIQLSVGCPFCREIVLMEDRSHRTFRNAGFAVNALVRMNEQNSFAFVEAFDWTNNHTVSVFAVKTRFGHNVSHFTTFRARQTGKNNNSEDPEASLQIFGQTEQRLENSGVHQKTSFICPSVPLLDVLCQVSDEFPDLSSKEKYGIQIETESRSLIGDNRGVVLIKKPGQAPMQLQNLQENSRYVGSQSRS